MASDEKEIASWKMFAQRSANIGKVNYAMVTLLEYPNNTKSVPYYMYDKEIHSLVEIITPKETPTYEGPERRKK